MVRRARAVNRYEEHAALSRESILLAAEFVIDAEGRNALTMRRLGRELGVEAMSLYHHVQNKVDVEATIVTRLLSPGSDTTSHAIDDSRSEEDPTTADVERYVRAIRERLIRYPHRLPLVLERLPATLFDAPAPRRIIDVLVEYGFDDSAARWILDACIGYAIGHAIVQQTDGRATTSDDAAAFETGLRLMVLGLRAELGL